MHVHANKDERLDHFLSLSLEELANLEITISSDSRKPVTQAPAVVTVITEEDIKATGSNNLADILESVPGINIRSSQFANRPLIHFRGASATQTLLMVNGAPMKDLMWGFGIFWKGLPTSMIERVEIIRGPGSALFGADAASGVINVITKTAGVIRQSSVGVRLGSFGSKSMSAQYGGEWNGFEMGFTAELQDTDGHDPLIAADAQTRRDLIDGTSVSYAPGEAQYGWRNADLRFSLAKGNWRLMADYMDHSDMEIGLTGAGVLDPVTEAEDSRFNLGLFYDNEGFHDEWGLNAELRYQHLDYSSGNGFQERPPGYAGNYSDGLINQMRSAERQVSAQVSGRYAGLNGHDILLGVGYRWQDLYRVEQSVNFGYGPNGRALVPGAPLTDISDTVYAFAPEQSRTINYLFVQDVWKIADDWELTAGARYDYYSDFGDSLNPRLALVWQGSDSLTTKLMYGQAFRAPSFQELFSDTSFTLPNSDLEPERSRTWDLSFSYAATDQLHLSLSAFYLSQSDLIRAVAVPGLSKRQFQNIGYQDIRGIELEARWQPLRNLRISGNYTIREQDESAFRAVGLPDQDAYIRLDWGLRPDWNWNLQTNWIGKRKRVAGDQRSPVDAYYLTDTTLRYGGIQNLELSVSIRNLFDVDAREYTGSAVPDDLPLPGRSVFAEARWNF